MILIGIISIAQYSGLNVLDKVALLTNTTNNKYDHNNIKKTYNINSFFILITFATILLCTKMYSQENAPSI